jgi:hypothetical protein
MSTPRLLQSLITIVVLLALTFNAASALQPILVADVYEFLLLFWVFEYLKYSSIVVSLVHKKGSRAVASQLTNLIASLVVLAGSFYVGRNWYLEGRQHSWDLGTLYGGLFILCETVFTSVVDSYVVAGSF